MGFILSWIRHTATIAMRVLRLNLPKNGPADTSFRFSAPRMVSDDIVVPLSAASVSADLLVSVRFQGMTTTMHEARLASFSATLPNSRPDNRPRPRRPTKIAAAGPRGPFQ
jgi:hypothetical protein